MRTKACSFPEAYLSLKMGKSARIMGWKDKCVILVPEKKIYMGNVEHPLIKKYLEGMDGYDKHFTVAERFQLVYSPSDLNAICSDGIEGPHLIDNYQISADEMRSLSWVIHDFV